MITAEPEAGAIELDGFNAGEAEIIQIGDRRASELKGVMALSTVNADVRDFGDIKANGVISICADEVGGSLGKAEVKGALIAIGVNGAASGELNRSRANDG